MARADTIVRLPLDTWARIMAINPCAWNQVVNPNGPYPTDCKATWLQHGWFDSVPSTPTSVGVTQVGLILGREDVAQAIASAEQNMASALGFDVAPYWITGEEARWQYPKRGAQVSYPDIQARNGQVIMGGIEASTLVASDRVIVYSDRSGDGIPDTASITITAAEMTAASASHFELAVYYPSDYLDFYLYPRDESWRIKPLNIVQNPNGTVTIWGHRCQFVQPELWLRVDDIIQNDAGSFLSHIDVYRRYTDISQQAQIVYKSGTGTTCTSTACAESCQTACLQVMDERLGIVKTVASTYNATTGTYSPLTCLTDAPASVRMWYLAGYYKRYNSWIEADWMEARLARAITLLSLMHLPDAVCGCDQTRRLYERYREEQDIDSLDASMAQQYFGLVTKGSVFAASTVRLMNPIYGGGNM